MTSPIEPHLSLPTAAPINASFANDDIEAALKQLFADLFEKHLASALHDVNALGMPHLGTFDLVRRNVNADGLALLPGSSEEDATRYLYRAWRSRDSDGRGLHFLKTYLQMLFPNICELEQMMQSKHQAYPLDLYPASLHSGDPDKYLTSRIEIGLDYSTEMTDFTKLMSVFRAILPARLSPLFKFRLLLLLWIESRIDSTLFLQKAFNMKANPCGLRVSESTEFLWQLGRDIDYKKLGHNPAFSGLVGQSLVKLQNYDSTFNLDVDGQWKVGQWQGGVWIAPPPKLDGSWPVGINTTYECFVKLGDCRIRTSALLSKFTQTKVYQPHLNQPGLTLNGLWHIVERMTSRVLMTSKTVITAPQHIETTFGEHLRCEYPFTPKRLNGGAFGFPVRKPGIYIDTATGLNKIIEGHVNPEKLKLPRIAKLDGHALDGHWKIGGDHGQRTLNGAWKIGATHWIIDSHTALDLQTHAQQPLVVDVTSSNHVALDYPYKTRLARLPKLNPWHPLNGTWQVGRAESKAPFGFKLRETGVLVDHTASLVKQHSIDGLGRYHYLRHSNKLDGQSLTGKWQIGGGDKRFTLNGTWRVGERYQQLDSHIINFSHSQINAKPSLITTFSDHAALDYPHKTRLARLPKLNPWHPLNGTWQVGRAESKAPFGFKLRETGVLVEAYSTNSLTKLISAYGVYNTLPPLKRLDTQNKLSGKWQIGGSRCALPLNGSWQIGRRKLHISSTATLTTQATLAIPQHVSFSSSDQFTIHYPGRHRLGKPARLTHWQSFNSGLKLGGAVSSKPFGFPLYADESIPIDSTVNIGIDKIIDVIDNRLKLGKTAKLSRLVKLNGSQSLGGTWQVGGSSGHVLLNGSFKLGGAIKHQLSINGAWKLGQRTQLVYSSAVMRTEDALSIIPTAEASIAIYKGNFFSFFNEAGAVNYQLISTMSPDQPPQPNNVLINNRLKLSPQPIGDIFMHKGIVYREIEPGVLLAEDHDNVSVVIDAGVYYAQFDSAVNLNGLYAEVTYLAAI